MWKRYWFIIMVILIVSGCDNKDKLVPEPVTHTPLELDPTQPVEVTGWWANDNQLLHIQNNSGYTVYPGQNRYADPVQRGQWWKQSYATIWFEPYTEFDAQPYRGRLVRKDDTVMLRMGESPAMRKLEDPPTAIEDHLFGSWSGEAGVLSLRQQGRYRFSPRRDETNRPVAIAGHSGRWKHENGEVVLNPDAPNLSVIRLRIIEQDTTRTLEGLNSTFTKQGE